jgi:hypothetical protein
VHVNVIDCSIELTPEWKAWEPEELDPKARRDNLEESMQVVFGNFDNVVARQTEFLVYTKREKDKAFVKEGDIKYDRKSDAKPSMCHRSMR